MKTKNIILFLILGLALYACKTRPLPECINKETANLTIRWGEQNKKDKVTKGFIINGKGQILKFVKDTSKTEKTEELGYVDGKWFCAIADSIQNAILLTQVSNEPGDLTEFIEFANPSASIYYRGQWVRKFKTANSILFRTCYDSLQAYKIMKEE